MYKMDFEKAYDFVSCCFLDYMVRIFGFDHWLRGWIRTCVFSRSLLGLNEYQTKEIYIHKGLKHRGPLAHFLFLLVAESLSASLNMAVPVGVLQGFKVGSNELEVSHLQYFDNTFSLSYCGSES